MRLLTSFITNFDIFEISKFSSVPRWRSPERYWFTHYWVGTHQQLFLIDSIGETEDLGIEGSKCPSFL